MLQVEYFLKKGPKLYLCEIISFDAAPLNIEITFDIFWK